jgi:serine/threonine protein kinase/tetratricopeptide (TPR) repeat protein
MKRIRDIDQDCKLLDEASTVLGGGAEDAGLPSKLNSFPKSSSTTNRDEAGVRDNMPGLSPDSNASRSGGGFPIRFKPSQVIAERYEIRRFVGRGSMGEVYEAYDNALNERVALKTILYEDASDVRATLRFKREIQLARKVTHPNVCRIFEFGSHQETGSVEGASPTPAIMFLTMEFLAGETLTERLNHAGHLSKNEALPIIEQIAAGLEAAHQAGIVHRDFKPGNVMLVPAQGGIRAVVTDFGLARASAVVPGEPGSFSMPGEIVGTPEYMAPEQLKGEPPTPATDIYALGIVMYAMVTGKLPFVGGSRRAAALKRLEERPTSPRQHAPDLDPRWERVILRCLERNPADRFGSARQIVRELHGEGAGTVGDAVEHAPSSSPAWFRITRRALYPLAGLAILLLALMLALSPSVRQQLKQHLGLSRLPEVKRLAVLPFRVVGSDPETKAFADGLIETLTAKLSQLGSEHPLEVVPAGEIRTMGISSPEQARRELGVNLAITGSLQRSNSMIRVTPVLVDTPSERQLGGDAIDASTSDPFSVQDRVVSSVVAMMEIHPQAQENAVLAAHGTLHPAAYDYYLRGRGYLQDYQRLSNIDSAITVFEKALTQDSKFPLAYAGLGEAYWHKYELTKDLKLVGFTLQNCEIAAKLKPEVAEAHSCLGTVFTGTGKYEQAVKEFQSAIKLEPTNDDAYRSLAMAYEALGKNRDAESTFKQGITLRPQYWSGYSRLGAFYFKQAHYNEAAEMFAQVMALAPDNGRGYSNLGAVYLAQGRYADAIPLFDRAAAMQPTADAYSNLGTAYFQMRRFADANQAYKKATEIDARSYATWGNLADAEFLTPDRLVDSAAACKKAIELAKQALHLNPRDSAVMADLADYYSMLQDRDNALRYLQEALALTPNDPWIRSRAAEVYNQLGDTEQAVRWLKRAVAAGYSVTMIRDTPALDNLRADPRVKVMLEGK